MKLHGRGCGTIGSGGASTVCPLDESRHTVATASCAMTLRTHDVQARHRSQALALGPRLTCDCKHRLASGCLVRRISVTETAV